MANERRLVIQILGRFNAVLRHGTEDAPQPLSRQERALIAYLALQPNFTDTRERLAALIWDSTTDRQARQNLRQCLLVLRKKMESQGVAIFKGDRHAVVLDPEWVDVDAPAFLALAQSDKSGDLDRAMTLYRGELLTQFALDVGSFDAWLAAERSRFAAVAIGLFERCAARCDEAGLGDAAVGAAERLVAVAADNEGAQRILLRLLARYRGRESALAHAAVLLRTLREEFGVEPEPETQRLLHDIRSGLAPEQRVVAREQEPETLPPLTPASSIPSAESKRAVLPQQPRRDVRRSVAFGAAVALALGAVAGVSVLGLTLFLSGPTPSNTRDPWRTPGFPIANNSDVRRFANSAVYPIIVLPFRTNVSGTSDERRLADRLTSNLINDLSRSPNTRVISAQTARFYAGKNMDVAQLGAELGVKYVIEGDLQIEDGRLRLNVGLTDSGSRLVMWSDRFEGESLDPVSIRDDLTRAITRRLQISIVAMEDHRRAPSENAANGIDDLLAKGWAATTRISRADTTSGADRYFSEVLARDPDNVSALIGLGAFHVVGAAMFLETGQTFDLAMAEQLLTRALALQPRASMAYYYLGVLHKVRGRPDAALSAFRQTLEINPSYAPAYAQVGHVLSRTGHLNTALEHVRYAIRLSPRDHNIGLWSLFGGQIELEQGHTKAAIAWMLRAADAAPRSPYVHAALAAAYALVGDRESQSRHVAETRRLAPSLNVDQMVLRLIGQSTGGGEPQRLIDGLRKAFVSEG